MMSGIRSPSPLARELAADYVPPIRCDREVDDPIHAGFDLAGSAMKEPKDGTLGKPPCHAGANAAPRPGAPPQLRAERGSTQAAEGRVDRRLYVGIDRLGPSPSHRSGRPHVHSSSQG